MKVKEESEKAGIKLSIQTMKIMASGPITSWQINGETTETDPEVSDVYQHIRGMPEESDANFTSSKRYLTKGKLSETQNRF